MSVKCRAIMCQKVIRHMQEMFGILKGPRRRGLSLVNNLTGFKIGLDNKNFDREMFQMSGCKCRSV